MNNNVEEMSYSELVEFAKKVSNSLLSIDEKSEYFTRIDAREKLLDRDNAVCAESELSTFDFEDVI
jgi:hypothetical protein